MKLYHHMTREEQKKYPPPPIPKPRENRNSFSESERAKQSLNEYMKQGFSREEAIRLMVKGVK